MKPWPDFSHIPDFGASVSVYLVGGAVRDRLMDLKPGEISKDCDYVVVGATPDLMKQHKFRQVGKDFPVFLHPISGEEFALARSEKKVGQGYHGFEFNFTSDISLSDDLKRRDITINAIALDIKTQKIIDPYGGIYDIQKKNIKAVSPAFSDDPLRLLRLARFAAKFPDFSVDEGTKNMLLHISKRGELRSLSMPRIWAEVTKACTQKSPARFFQILHGCGAHQQLFDCDPPQTKVMNETDAFVMLFYFGKKITCYPLTRPQKRLLKAVEKFKLLESASKADIANRALRFCTNFQSTQKMNEVLPSIAALTNNDKIIKCLRNLAQKIDQYDFSKYTPLKIQALKTEAANTVFSGMRSSS